MEAAANKTQCDWEDPSPQSKGPKDLQVQLVLSLILGISAFVTFCVRILYFDPPALLHKAYQRLDSSPAMAVAVPRSQAPTARADGPSDSTEYLLWVDSKGVQDNRGPGSGVCRLGRFRGMLCLNWAILPPG